MIDIKMLKGTGPYNQMKRYIEEEHAALSPQQRAGKFTALLKCYVSNCNLLHPKRQVVVGDIIDSFAWFRTPEGRDFWQEIDKQSTEPVLKVKAPKPAPIVEQPQVVWPEGATHYTVRVVAPRFFNKKGQWVITGKGVDNFLKFEGARTYELWSAHPDTIKRPETPLPKPEMRWPEWSTHCAKCGAAWFFFNEEQYLWVGQVKPWEVLEIREGYKAKPNTIKRYPDNQPLLLKGEEPMVVGAPVVRPVPFLRQRLVEVAAPVPPPPQAAVELPKAVPKKQVGWWT